MQKDSVDSRRQFLRTATSSIGIAFSAPVIAALVASCETTETQPAGPTKNYDVKISDHPLLADVGGIDLVFIEGFNGDNPVFISRVAETAFVVFTTVCTHQGCRVDLPSSAGDNCHCPCHSAEYSPQDGSIRRQPNGGSATDLPKFASSYNAATDTLTITG